LEKELFIRQCAVEGRILWTYHVNMRLEERKISTVDITIALNNCSIIEEYSQDVFLPSYLVLGYDNKGNPVHVVIALDEKKGNIRIITSYRPSLGRWENGFKIRRGKR